MIDPEPRHDRPAAGANSGSLGRSAFSPSSSWAIPQPSSLHHDAAAPLERALSGSYGAHWAAGPAVVAGSEPSSSSMMGMLARTTMPMSREGSFQRDLSTLDERYHDNSPAGNAFLSRRASATDCYSSHHGHDHHEHPPPIHENLPTLLSRHSSFGGGGAWNGLSYRPSYAGSDSVLSEANEAQHQVVFAHDAVKVVHSDRALIYSRIPNPDGDEPVLQLETVRYNRGEMLRKGLECIRGTQRFEGLLDCMASFPRWGGLVAGPALAATLMIGFNDTPERSEMQVAGVLVWMALWWLLEVVPVAVTALLPALLWPILGVMSAEDVASCYCNDAMSLIFGTFIMSVAVQRWGLDKRLAVLTVTSIGQRPRMLLAAVMGLTTFLGCLMSNTATATMMMPLVVAMVLAPNAHEEDPEQLPAAHPTPIPEEPETAAGTTASPSEPLLQRTPSMEKQRPDPEVARSYLKGMILATAYTCSISGFSTLTGTGPNLTFAGVWYSMSGEQVGWFQWLMFGLPLALSIEVFLFVIINVVYLRAPTAELAKAVNLDGLIRDRNALPPVRGAEVVVVADYAVCIFLWITRKISIGSFNGWHEYLPDVGNGTVALLCTIFLFVCPAKGVRSAQGGDAGTQGPRVMDWDAAKTIKWSTLILISGGFALSAGVTASGLDRLIAEAFSPLEALPHPVTLLATISLVVLITDWLVSSNVAVATLTLPILGTIAEDMGLHKLALMIPATIACSLSFCSPVATPPNAIAFSTGILKISEMVKTGACVAACAIVMTWGFSMTVGGRIFDYSIW